MTELNGDRLMRAYPNTPEQVHARIDETLAEIGLLAAKRRAAHRPARLRTAVIAAIAVVLLAAVAVAATMLSRNVLEMTIGAPSENAVGMIQYDLARESFDTCDIEIRQAAYDGRSLYVAYSVRERDATQMLGEAGAYDDSAIRRVSGESFPAMESDGIGWWCDQLWIDGRGVPVPALSGGQIVGGDRPGELVFYMIYRLDQEQVYLTGKRVEIALPIGRRQEQSSLIAGGDGTLQKPADGLVSFTLDCSLREGVTLTTPNEKRELPELTAWVSEAALTPIQAYVTLKLQAKSMTNALAWAETLQLCDGEGSLLETPGGYGYQGAADDTVWYTFPSMESWPDALYLAPMLASGEGVDMAEAVRVK